MIKIDGNTIWRDGSKIGWMEGNHVRAHDGTKMGYFEGNNIYNNNGNKVAYTQGNYLYSESGDKKVPMEKISEQIVGGIVSDIAKCAIYILL